MIRLIACAIVLMALVGCEHTWKPEDVCDIHRHEFDGHSYIVFGRSNWAGSSAVHDPDCKCQSR